MSLLPLTYQSKCTPHYSSLKTLLTSTHYHPTEQFCSNINKLPGDAFIGCSMYQKHLFLLKKKKDSRRRKTSQWRVRSVRADGVSRLQVPSWTSVWGVKVNHTSLVTKYCCWHHPVSSEWIFILPTALSPRHFVSGAVTNGPCWDDSSKPRCSNSSCLLFYCLCKMLDFSYTQQQLPAQQKDCSRS